MIRAGELKERLAIQRWTPVDDALWGKGVGGGWATVATICAKVETLAATERMQSQGVQSVITHRVTIRFTPDITTKDRLETTDGRVLDIVGIIDVQNRHQELQIECQEYQEAANG